MENSMKRIIIEMADNEVIDMQALSSVIALASRFTVETVGPDVTKPAHRHINKPGQGVTAHGEVMAHFTPDGVFQASAAASWLAAKGYMGSTAGSALSQLGSAGFIKSLGSGKWQFVKPMEAGYKLKPSTKRA